MSKVWFTADSHFNHRSMIERRWRPMFSSVREMDETIIGNWNSVVRPDDVVWHDGDVGMGSLLQWLPNIAKLNGVKHLITGNHDHCWPGNRNAHKYQQTFIEAGFASVQQYARVRDMNGRTVMLSHFPYEVDDRHGSLFVPYQLRDTGEWLVHGHVHGAWDVRGRQINVGVDVRDFFPVSLEEITSIIEKGPVE